MYYDFAIAIPSVQGKIITKRKGSSTYILYQYGQEYNPDKKYAVPQRTIIGKVAAGKPGFMFPNDKYQEYFPDVVMPEELPEAYRSSCLRIGSYIIIRKVLTEYNLPNMLGKYFGSKCGLFLDLVYAHRNLAFIGPPGTGKTHLAQAFGYECCQQGLKTYFIKMSELRDRFTAARRNGKEASCLNGLVRPACLIIDEVGHCEFDKENTRLFFDMVDRRYNRQGCNNIIFTSNKNPALWKENFNEDDDLLCALDRIFDDATVFNIRGESYRGKMLERISLTTSKVNTGSSEQTPNN